MFLCIGDGLNFTLIKLESSMKLIACSSDEKKYTKQGSETSWLPKSAPSFSTFELWNDKSATAIYLRATN